MTTPKKKPTHTPPPPTAHPAADLIIDQLIDQQIAKDEKRSHSPLSGGNEKGGKIGERGEGGEGGEVSVGSVITPIFTSYLRSAPKINASTATALIHPGARLKVLDILQLDGNTWLKVEAYIALTYQNDTLCKLAD